MIGKRKEQKACVTRLMGEGAKLRDWWPSDQTQGQLWNDRYKEWSGLVRSEIGSTFSVDDAARLFTSNVQIDHGCNFQGGGHHQENHARLRSILDALDDMFKALPLTG